MAIPVTDLLRLLSGVIGRQSLDQKQFEHWMRDGVHLTPVLDMQDVATLARIASGERYEWQGYEGPPE